MSPADRVDGCVVILDSVAVLFTPVFNLHHIIEGLDHAHGGQQLARTVQERL